MVQDDGGRLPDRGPTLESPLVHLCNVLISKGIA